MRPGVLLCLTLVLAPGVQGLGAVRTDEGVRFLLDEGENVTVQALEGDPWINGARVSGEPVAVDEAELSAWEGYDRTWLVSLSGAGSVLVWGNGSGLVLQGDRSSAESAPGSSGPAGPGDGVGPAGEAGGQGTGGGASLGDEGGGAADAPVPVRGGEPGGSRKGGESERSTVWPWAVLAGSVSVAAAPVAWRWMQGRAGQGDAE